jgi:O-antigen ligase
MKYESYSRNKMMFAFAAFCFVIFITPGLSMFSALGLVPFYMIFAIVPLLCFLGKREWNILYDGGLQKIIIVSLLYILISCLWSLDPSRSVILWAKLVCFASSAFILFDFIKKYSSQKKDKLVNVFFVGIIIAAVLVAVEVITNGFISKLVRFNKPEYIYYLTDLNRGASFLSICFWPCVGALLYRGKILYAALIGGLILLAVCQLESMSSVLGLVVGIIIAGAVYKFGRNIIKFLMVVVVFGVVAIPAVTTFTKAEQLNNIIPVIPGAASVYRINIWEFAGKKAMEKPVFGWGFDASRNIPVKKSDYFAGGRYPLPLHPHNNIIQVWLELGVVGLVLFAAFLIAILSNIASCKSRLYMSLSAGLFSGYFMLGEMGYGVWQNWLIAAGILSAGFLLISRKEE